MRISRRAFLAASSLIVPGCAVRRAAVAPPLALPHLARVNVSPERVIRVTVGLRPFRPSGFVVRAEKFDDKVVVHNYGHGGAGITLSWGTAQLALQQALKVGRRDCAVIGCGVVGLSTARLLQQNGFNPTIYAKDVPPLTTSNMAGGLWEAVTLFDDDRVTPEFQSQLNAASEFAYRRYQSMAGDLYGVRWLPVYSLSNQHQLSAPPGDDEHPETRLLSKAEDPFDVTFARRRQNMLIEPAIYLNALLRDFELAGGKVVVREFPSLQELLALPQSLLLNCTGLGAKALFNDAELTPVRGQLVFLLPQPEIDYMTVGPGDIYMFPRHDGILLGGTHDRDVWDTAPNPADTERILRENQGLFSAMRA